MLAAQFKHRFGGAEGQAAELLASKGFDREQALRSVLQEIEAAKAEYLNTKRLQERIWEQATPATRLPEAHPDAGRLLLPALNAMFDITTTRLMASRLHPPPIIFYLLFILASLCSLLVGYGMAAAKRRRWLHVLAFSLTVVISVFVILDIEDPRSGYIRLDPYDQALVDLRAGMK